MIYCELGRTLRVSDGRANTGEIRYRFNASNATRNAIPCEARNTF